MRIGRVLPVVVGLTTLVFACEALVGIEDRDFRLKPKDPDTCVRVTLPERPDASVDQGARPYLFAVQGLETSPNPDGTPVGFDLDNSCTCTTLRPTENDGGYSCTPPGDPAAACDEPGGVDNSVAKIVASFGNIALLDLASFEKPFRCGESTLLLLLTQYNGKAFDNEVQLQLLESRGIREPRTDRDAAIDRAEVGCSFNVNDTTFPARFDGQDRWTTVEEIGPDFVSKSPVLTGWVSNYTLVVDNKTDDRVPFIVFGRVVQVSRPRLRARLTPTGEDGGRLAIDPTTGEVAGGIIPSGFITDDSTMAGRIPFEDMLRAAGEIRIEGGGDGTYNYVCKSAPLFELARSLICAGRDSKRSPLQDFQPGPCDALSIGVRVRGRTALAGGRWPPAGVDDPPTDPGCDPELFKSCN